ncbi:PPFIA1 isoform 17, partial [Pongo abelii]
QNTGALQECTAPLQCAFPCVKLTWTVSAQSAG